MSALSQATGPVGVFPIKSDTWRANAMAAILLLLPFLIVSHCLDDLRIAILTFHGTDELIFHYPAILRFAGQWPDPSLADYSSATTPLFHLVFSLLGKLVGFELYKLRAANALISFAAGLVYFKILRTHFHHSWTSALVMGMVFLMSPYFFGVSFILLTDNLAWLFCMLALHCFLSSLRLARSGLPTWALGCAFLCLALLTRQSFAWLLLSAAAFAWFHTRRVADRLVRVALLGVAALPLAALVIAWHGLMPPSFQEAHEARSLLNPRAPGFTLAVLGLYFALFNPRRFLEGLAAMRPAVIGAVLGGLLLVAAVPLSRLAIDDGFLWRLSQALPAVCGSSLLFWLLVPMGGAAAVMLFKDAPTSIGSLSLLAFALSVLPSNLLFQKYFDPFIPVFVLLARPKLVPAGRLEAAVLSVLLAAFVAYAALPYAHPAFYR